MAKNAQSERLRLFISTLLSACLEFFARSTEA
jgi:hypothetical protein